MMLFSDIAMSMDVSRPLELMLANAAPWRNEFRTSQCVGKPNHGAGLRPSEVDEIPRKKVGCKNICRLLKCTDSAAVDFVRSGEGGRF